MKTAALLGLLVVVCAMELSAGRSIAKRDYAYPGLGLGFDLGPVIYHFTPEESARLRQQQHFQQQPPPQIVPVQEPQPESPVANPAIPYYLTPEEYARLRQQQHFQQQPPPQIVRVQEPQPEDSVAMPAIDYLTLEEWLRQQQQPSPRIGRVQLPQPEEQNVITGGVAGATNGAHALGGLGRNFDRVVGRVGDNPVFGDLGTIVAAPAGRWSVQ
jgi:hypothetical protein